MSLFIIIFQIIIYPIITALISLPLSYVMLKVIKGFKLAKTTYSKAFIYTFTIITSSLLIFLLSSILETYASLTENYTKNPIHSVAIPIAIVIYLVATYLSTKSICKKVTLKSYSTITATPALTIAIIVLWIMAMAYVGDKIN